MANEARFLRHDVFQAEGEPRSVEMPNNLDTIIRFRVSEEIGACWMETPTTIIYGEPKLVADEDFPIHLSDFKRLCKRPWNAGILGYKLSSFGVAEYEQGPIFEKIFRLFQVAVPGRPITVSLTFVLLRFKPVPLTISTEGLEQLRLDSLEATLRKTSCLVCEQTFDPNGVVEGQADDYYHPMITRLPCSHLYHGHCISLWLEMHHFCPSCQYPMPPNVEVEAEPKNPTSLSARGWQPFWEQTLRCYFSGIDDSGTWSFGQTEVDSLMNFAITEVDNLLNFAIALIIIVLFFKLEFGIF